MLLRGLVRFRAAVALPPTIFYCNLQYLVIPTFKTPGKVKQIGELLQQTLILYNEILISHDFSSLSHSCQLGLPKCLPYVSQMLLRCLPSHLISFISSHFISFHFISSHLISSHLISFHLISFHFISSHLISSHFISFHLISFHFISSHLISFHLITFHFISFHFISSHLISSPFISSHLISSHPKCIPYASQMPPRNPAP